MGGRGGLRVGVNQGGGGGGGTAGDAIIFEVNPAAIDFGSLNAGQGAEEQLGLRNEGTGSVRVEALVNGDPLFAQNLTVDAEAWNNYQAIMPADTQRDVTVGLAVPADYLGAGVKTGEIIFWASSN